MDPAQVAGLRSKQQQCVQVTTEKLEGTLQHVKEALGSLRTGSADTRAVLTSLLARLKASKMHGSASGIGAATATFHEAIKQFGKDLDTLAPSDINAAARAERLPKGPLNKLILDDLYRMGLFDVGDVFAAEAAVQECPHSKTVFSDMHRILARIRDGHLQDALEWVQRNRDSLSGQGEPTKLEFQLHRLVFLDLVQNQGALTALQYARTHFAAFSERFMPEVRQLMGCMAYAHRPLRETPYAELVEPAMLEGVANEIVREACGLLGQAAQSPLTVAIAAGSVALPQLLKLAKISKRSGQPLSGVDLATCKSMPIELELGSEFNFHSIFACPVSKEQTDMGGNPPKLLPCGHVISAHSIENMASSHNCGRNGFKCPYCPQETQSKCCRKLTFPDVQ